MTRDLLRCLARCLIGMLLMAQLSIASYACPGLAAALAARQAPPSDHQSAPGEAKAAVMADCEDMAGALDPGSANRCAEHCKYGQQSDQAPSLLLPLAVLSVRYSLDPAPDAGLPRAGDATQAARRAPPPGHAVLHRVYRL